MRKMMKMTTTTKAQPIQIRIPSIKNERAVHFSYTEILFSVIKRTDVYLSTKTKTERKKIGQFFTSKETAIYMASLFDIPNVSSVNICDPGAGTGILAAALIERLENESKVQEINLVCYENDKETAEILEENLQFIANQISLRLNYKVLRENYITSQSNEYNNSFFSNTNPKKFDLIIGNPPYQKISKNADEATQMKDVCYGAPNLYFLFAAMSIFNLRTKGEMVYIIPRSWTSGAYFKVFREFIFSTCNLEQMHLFVSRDKVFDKEEVLQETMIFKLVKGITRKVDTILITSSQNNHDFKDITKLKVPYPLVVSEKEKYVYLITNNEEIAVLRRVHKYSKTLPEIGLKMKTGLTVDFRNKEFLRELPEEGNIPLFYSQNMKDGRIVFPNKEKELQYVVPQKSGLRQDNQNYLFVKRFTAKEEKRRLQCGMYFAEDFPDYEYISTQNKINFITTIDGTMMSKDLLAGLFVLLNSSLYDSYYRILNGSTQVNSTEINNISVPDRVSIEEMGRRLLSKKHTTTEACDLIMEELYD